MAAATGEGRGTVRPKRCHFGSGSAFGGRFTDGLQEQVRGLIEQQIAYVTKVGRLAGIATS
ncbi:hypothetical protein BM536_037620 [Streptomyces phaeoluteigriseus]|uniref:Uncharacterized protein n=1 Tax=Streptomyces phaeoluteigriseus TaxID=114686 RepID=A0A1V6MHA3_9ACTN|nr:hypothetical protein [Streptomyces phaeoluteigriseus]OQD51840.1 hypothetical protein BM536_037620 [Streptomyces phaeoluteigriseus]